LESSGNVLPPKLGEGQDERNTAASSLPANWTANEPVPRRLTLDLNWTRVSPVSAGKSGAFASTSAAPLQAVSRRRASRHGIHCCWVPSTTMLSVERSPVRLAAAPNAIDASFQMKRPSLSATKSRRRPSGGTVKTPLMSTLAS